MAVETPSISRPTLQSASMDYEQLFLQGIQHIELLSGKIWTDYNAHDPGITILEMLCYAITELGYRCDFVMGDIVEAAPESKVLNEFLSIANAASNAPLTIDDFRKILIDIDGNRNAWLEKVTYEPMTSTNEEVGAIVDLDPNASLFLHYAPSPQLLNTVGDKQIKIKGLYDVFLQFDEHPEYGDLNDNSLKTKFLLQPIGFTVPTWFEVEFEFPIWGEIDSEIADALSRYLRSSGTVTFELKVNPALAPSMIEDYVYSLGLKVKFNDGGGNRTLLLPMTARLLSGRETILNPFEFRSRLEDQIDLQVYDSSLSSNPPMALLVKDFILRRQVIQDRLEAARRKLANHRNLCEDFRNVHPMSLQEIGLDLSLDVDQAADCEGVLALVYYATQQYLSPPIRFYSLREMLERGYTTEEIFRGPWLLNGFIDSEDLAFYQRREIIHTSDLVQEFMKIPGVRAVNRISFTRYEQGRIAVRDTVPQTNLDDCLCLLNPARFLPRLNTDRSLVIMNCGQARPSQPDKSAALQRLSELKATDAMKGRADQGDFAIPSGMYRNLGQYDSIQNDFPVNYAIGIEGLVATETNLRKSQAQQLKGYLLFFEQVLANFLAQLENLRLLFSYSDDMDRTYFTQTLYAVPRVQGLIRDYTENHSGMTWTQYMANPTLDSNHYANRTNVLAENEATFLDRRKRFLDHLLGRFNETFSQYAAYVYGKALDEAGAQGILIHDQARFLRNYVMHSHDRGTGFNYQRSRELDSDLLPNWYWRAGLDIESLNRNNDGTEALPVEATAHVDPYEEFDIYQDAAGYWRFRLYDASGVNMLHSVTGLGSKDDVLALMDQVLLHGTAPAQYQTPGFVGQLVDVSSTVLAKLGQAFVNSYSGSHAEAAEALAAYLVQLQTVDELPVENKAGHVLWQGVNDVTGIKKRMTFLMGLPNVNRAYINPFARYNITGTVPNLGFELLDDEGTVVMVSPAGTSFPNVDALLQFLLELPDRVADCFPESGGGLDLELRRSPGITSTTIAVLLAEFESSITDPKDRRDALVAYMRGLGQVENLHVVEHILLRQRFTGDPTLKVRIVQDCPALDIEDPYSFRVSVVLPAWAGRFQEQAYRTVFKQVLRAELPAHVYVHFLWLDPIQMYKFEHCWAQWLVGAWDSDELDSSGENMATCLNRLCNTLDARYVVEVPKIKDSYVDCELLAEPVDPDGEIVMAILDPLTPLPPGMCMDPCSGAIRVAQAAALVNSPNSFDLHIKTINAGGEETCHNLTLHFIPNGNTVVSDLAADRRICSYRTTGYIGEKLLSFSDPDGPVVFAEFMQWTREDPSGTLLQTETSFPPDFHTVPPAGMGFDFINGDIFITSPSALLSGIYKFQVYLRDNSGGVSIRSVVLNILPDQEMTASITPARNEDAYANGDILATLTDPDGNISTAAIVGSIPGLGIVATLPAPSVPIVVTNATAFQNWLRTTPAPTVTIAAGRYNFSLTVRTNDYCGGQTDLSIPLKVIVDREATFTPVPVINVSLHYNGSLAGTVQDGLDGGLANDVLRLADNNALLSPDGLQMAYTTGDPRTARITVSNRSAFIAAINAAPADSNRVATLTYALETLDITGGKSTVTATIRARQDVLPVVTTSAARNADTYQQGERLALIEDGDGNGIVSASHISTNFTLNSIGLRLRTGGGYAGYNPGGNSGNNLRIANPTGAPYQPLPAPQYYQQPTEGYAEVIVDNVALFRQAVASMSHYLEVNPTTHLLALPLLIQTTDSLGGYATSAVTIEVIQDQEATAVDIMNGERIGTLQTGSVMTRFLNTDPNTNFSLVNINPPLHKAFGVSMQPDLLDVIVVNEAYLEVGSSSYVVETTDSQGGITNFQMTLNVLPRLVVVSFAVPAAQQGHMLSINGKVAGLKVSNFEKPLLPKAFGSLSVNNGLQLGFTEGTAFASSTYPMSVAFKGEMTTTQEQVDGILTITRLVGRSNAAPGAGQLSNNPRLNARMTQGDAKLRSLANDTDALATRMQMVTYYADNPMLRTQPQVMASFAAGDRDAEVAASYKSLLQRTTEEVLKIQTEIRAAKGIANAAASTRLSQFAELLALQTMGWVNYLGNIRESDLDEGNPEALESVFSLLRDRLAEILGGSASSSSFTELSHLRGTLWSMQDMYAETKPLLNEKIEALLPKASVSYLDEIERRLVNNPNGKVDAELLAISAEARGLFTALNSLLADTEFRQGWNDGTKIEEGWVPFVEPMKQIASYLESSYSRLLEMPYGIAQQDLLYSYGLGAEMIVVLANAMFEHLEQLPVEAQETPIMHEGMSYFLKLFKQVSSQPLLSSFQNLLSTWASRWTLKPAFSQNLAGSLEVARLEFLAARPMEAYKAGDVLARVRMVSGNLGHVHVSKGLLPLGLVLSPEGRIEVADPKALIEGIFGGIELSGSNDRGFDFTLPVPDIEFLPDSEAYYVVNAPMPLSEYTDGLLLAYPKDADGRIVTAQVTAGKFPTGVKLNTESGEFSVAKASRLVQGEYPLVVTTTDHIGGVTEHSITIVIGNGSGGAIAGDPLNLMGIPLPQSNGNELGEIKIQGATLAGVSLANGKLPEGIALNSFGKIIVEDEQSLAPGTSIATAHALATDGKTYAVTVTVELLAGKVNTVSVSHKGIGLPQNQGTVLASLSVPGKQLINYQIILGGIPNGLSLITNGDITVSDPQQMQSGNNYFEVSAFETGSGESYRFQVSMEFIMTPVVLPDEFAVREIQLQEVLPLANNVVLADLRPAGASLDSVDLVYYEAPSGIIVNSQAEIVVADGDTLIAGEHKFLVRMKYLTGTTHLRLVHLRLEDLTPLAPDPNRLVVAFSDLTLPATNGAAVGVVTANNAMLQSVQVMGGHWIPGLKIAPTGHVTVEDETLLHTGSMATLLDVMTVDDQLFQIELQLRVVGSELRPASKVALYAEYPNKLLPIAAGTYVGSVTFPPLSISTVTLTGGTLPPGFAVESPYFRVITEEPVQAGDYDVLLTAMLYGGSTVPVYARLSLVNPVPVSIEFPPAELPLFIGDVVGTVEVEGSPLSMASIVSGALPPNMAIRHDGQVTAIPGQGRVPGIYEFGVVGWSTANVPYLVSVTLELVDLIDSESFAQTLDNIGIPQPNGSVLGLIATPDTDVSLVEVVGGTLPPGVSILPTSTLVVSDVDLLEVGIYTFEIICLGNDQVSYFGSIQIELVPG